MSTSPIGCKEPIEHTHASLLAAIGAVESRKLQLPIDKAFAFDDIGKAFEHMEANKHLGTIVVTL
jgi:hypothetical protein